MFDADEGGSGRLPESTMLRRSEAPEAADKLLAQAKNVLERAGHSVGRMVVAEIVDFAAQGPSVE